MWKYFTKHFLKRIKKKSEGADSGEKKVIYLMKF